MKKELQQIKLEWKKIIKENNIKNIQNVDKIIKNSWKRCLEQNLNPKKLSLKKITENKLKNIKAEYSQLIEFTIPFMKDIYQYIKNTSSIVVLTDKQGVILESFGDKNYLKDIKIALPGTSWNEKDLGTNGVGTALIEDKPLQIIAYEHFLQPNHKFSCSAAPIHDNYGNLIACLDITCPWPMSHFHTLGMVTSAAKAVEKHFALKATFEDKIAATEQKNAIFRLISEGIIVLNNKEEITSINKQAKLILQLNSKVIGKNFLELFPQSNDLKNIIKKSQNLINEEISFELKNMHSRCNISTAVIKNSNNEKEGLLITIREAEKINQMVNKITGSTAFLTFRDIIGQSEEIKDCIYLAKISAQSNSNVLLLGESGTGKELFAQSIHNYSKRKDYPFIAVNCGALPRELIQSELFGYAGGAFTGAKKKGHAGKFELAEGGTLFLDEIGDMPLDAQINLLRVLQNDMVTRVGGKYPKKVDVRIIAATNHNLLELVRENSFREDLYYRLNVLSINIPPLRERKDDIKSLIDYFIRKFSNRLNKTILEISDSAYKIMENYEWPGNIRELENVIERAVNIVRKEKITIEDLPYHLLKSPNSEKLMKQKQISLLQTKEKDTIKKVLEETNGNIRQTSLKLGISRSTLYEKIKKYKINKERFRKTVR